MNTDKLKTLIRLFIISMVSYMVTSLFMLLRDYAEMFTCVVYQALTIIVLSQFCKKIKPWEVLVTVLLGSSIIDVPIRIYAFTETLVSLPNSIGRLVAIISGYFVFKLISHYKTGNNS